MLSFNDLIISQVQYFKNTEGIRLYPQKHQLYPRNNNNQAFVEVKGSTSNTQIDEVQLLLHKHSLNSNISTSTYRVNTRDSFSFKVAIDAGMHLYTFVILLKSNNITIETDTLATDVVCGDVYIISGQSNAMGVTTGLPQLGAQQDSLYQQYPNRGSNQIYSKSFGNMPEYNGINGSLTNYDPNQNNWEPSKASPLHSLTGLVGIWGLKLQYLIQDHYQMPTCFINGAYGGTNIGEHQLGFGNNENPYNLETLFGCLNYRVQQANLKDKIKGVIWYQGENQNTYTRASTYQDSLNFLIDSWETHWGKFSKVYVIQIHTGCNHHGFGQIVREHQRTIQRPIHRHSTIVPITACGIGERASPAFDPFYNCHFSQTAYNELSNRLFQVIGRDFYTASSCITSPNILNASYAYDELVLEFDQDLAYLPEGIEQFFEFYKDNQLLKDVSIIEAYVVDNKIHCSINSQEANAVSYLLVDDPIHNNEMIWIKNATGFAAFSFHQFPIKTSPCQNSYFKLTSPFVDAQRPLEIELKSCNIDNKLSIYSLQGQQLLEKELPFVNLKTTINLDKLAVGLYFLTIESDGQLLETKKIIRY